MKRWMLDRWDAAGRLPAMTEDTAPPPRLKLAGDSAWLVDFGERTDDAVNNAAIAFDAHVRVQRLAGIVETASTIKSVLVRFDPLDLPAARLEALLRDWLALRDWTAAPPPQGRRRWRVPVHYGGTDGPDLDEVVALTGLDAAALIEDHGRLPQRVRMVGFAPGFVYTGMLGERWNLPRRTAVHPSIPPGSLAVAVRQTTLTSTAIPTGWRVIGRSPFLAFDLNREPPFLLQAGDELLFEPIDRATLARLEAKAAAGGTVAEVEAIP